MVYDSKKDYIRQALGYERAAAVELNRTHGDARRAVGFLNRAIDKYEQVGYKVQVGKLKRQVKELGKRRATIVRNSEHGVYDLNHILRPGQESRRTGEEFSVGSEEHSVIPFRLNPQYLKSNQLAEIVGSVMVMALGLFFISPALTGNAIGSLEVPASGMIGITLFVVGLLVGLFWVSNKKK